MAGNKGSGEAFSARFAEDAHLIGFDGMHFKARDEIVSFHQPLFEKWSECSHLAVHELVMESVWSKEIDGPVYPCPSAAI